MSASFADAIVGLNLEPGQTYQTTVADYDVKVCRRADPSAAAPTTLQSAEQTPPAEERSEFDDMVMLNIILNVPPSPNAITVKAKYGPAPPPDPPIVPPDDEGLE